ncbi:MAG: hypothetical protein HYW48_05460 [Deltaproteobacteria bacterium]|nr:hypothetical protein [Deltaproteobacteria bacterium]
MITIFLTLLALMDCVLILLVLKYFRKKELKNDLLAEITEERTLLTSLHDEIRTALQASDERSKKHIADISQLAAEVEQEIKNSSKIIAESIEVTIKDIGNKFNTPLLEIQNHRNAMEIMFRKVEKQKLLLQKMLDRTDTLCKFLGGNLPYDEILKELEQKKFADARHLITKGFTTEQVAKELGLNPQEVNLLRDMT